MRDMKIDTDKQRRVLLAALVSYRQALRRRRLTVGFLDIEDVRPTVDTLEDVQRKQIIATIEVLEQRLWSLDT